MSKDFEYKIEKNIPLVRVGSRQFDKTMPEYVVMMEMKIGDSFEFPADRVGYLQRVRIHLRKEKSPLCFTFPTPKTFKTMSSLKTGRCWRVKDGSFKKVPPRKNRAKGASIDLTEHK